MPTPLPPTWQAGALPLSYARIRMCCKVGPHGWNRTTISALSEQRIHHYTTRGCRVSCTNWTRRKVSNPRRGVQSPTYLAEDAGIRSWLGWQGSNLQLTEGQSLELYRLSYTPKSAAYRSRTRTAHQRPMPRGHPSHCLITTADQVFTHVSLCYSRR